MSSRYLSSPRPTRPRSPFLPRALVRRVAVQLANLRVSTPSDRRSVTWDPAEPWIPSEWRHPTQPADGSFHLDSLQVEDMLVTVYQPGHFRPYNVSIFRADIGTFRKKWLFYDFLVSRVLGEGDVTRRDRLTRTSSRSRPS